MERSFRQPETALLDRQLLVARAAHAIPQGLDVALDGQRFVMVQLPEATSPHINLVLNWFQELERLAPKERCDAGLLEWSSPATITTSPTSS